MKTPAALVPQRSPLLSYFSLFTSVSTLFCCALPSLLVLFGMGASVVSVISFMPWLVTLSNHKGLTFGISGGFIAWSFVNTYYIIPGMRRTECSPDEPNACASASKLSKIMLWASAVIYTVGVLVAFVLGPILSKLDGAWQWIGISISILLLKSPLTLTLFAAMRWDTLKSRLKPGPTARKRMVIAAIVLVVVYLAFGSYIWWAMNQPPEKFGGVMAKMPGPVPFLLFPFETFWLRARAGHLKVGDPAPDFSLLKLDKTERVQLSALNKQQPVVLVFGSYTWPPFRREVPALNKLYEQYQNRVAFLVVYITEAHPSDVWQMQSNIKDQVVFASPKNEEERAFIAGACVRKLGIKFPSVLDEFGNSTEQAYTGWPDRIYLIDGQGHIAYKSKPGPFGFLPDELSAALVRTLEPPKQAQSNK